MAICIRDTLQMVDYEYFPSLNALKFVLVDTKLQESRSFLSLYKKNSNVSQYLEALQYVLNIYVIDISLGPVYEFVCISFRTDNLNCFGAS